MAAVPAALVKQLRDQTGAGMMDCKAALTETDGDFDAAVDWLRKKGLAAAANKAGRVASQGLVGVAVNGQRGAVVEVNSETDFVARNDEFQKLVRVGAQAAAIERGEDAGFAADLGVMHGRIGLVIFESEAAYYRNAADPGQDRRYLQWRPLLESDPTWDDGPIDAPGATW